MRLFRLTAQLIALGVLSLPLAARAADLDYTTPPYDPYASKYGSPYDDPRYRDIYEHPRPAPRHAEPHYDAPRRAPGTYDDRYLRPMDRAPRFADGRGECLPRSEIRRRLAGDGWRDLHDLDIRGSIALVKARRPSGRLFDLEVDRCTGDIVRAEPLGPFEPRPYADGERRYQRYY